MDRCYRIEKANYESRFPNDDQRNAMSDIRLYLQPVIRKRDEMMRIKLTEELWKEGGMYVSYCPELDIAACGETVEQAKKNLKEVIEINLDEVVEQNGLL